MRRSVPELDVALRERLGRRFGSAIDSWLDELPLVLADLGARWQIDLETLVQRGSTSVVIRCRAADGRAAVLKVSPDRGRVQGEAAALARWETAHVPAVLAVDESVGALLTEAVLPGWSLVETMTYPRPDRLIGLVTALHADGQLHPSYRPAAARVADLYESGLKNYERRPDLAAVVSPELYERGRRLAMRLATETSATVLLHGDLTPANILEGGEQRGLVAIDPAPCIGDPAFDLVDLVLWQAADRKTIAERAEQLAPRIGSTAHRLDQWCAAFAAMTALELAEGSGSSLRVDMLLGLAAAGTR